MEENEIRTLLKRATQEAKTDLNVAIKTLKIALLAIAKENHPTTIEVYLRLPLYLQKAGRYAESLIEFEKLLKESRNAPTNSIFWTSEPHIYDKMRVAAEREKLLDDAFGYGILCQASECLLASAWIKIEQTELEIPYKGLQRIADMRCKRIEKNIAWHTEMLNSQLDFNLWINLIDKLIKKYDLKQVDKNKLMNVCQNFTKVNTRFAFNVLASEIKKLIFT